MRAEKLFQWRRYHNIQHLVIRKICSPWNRLRCHQFVNWLQCIVIWGFAVFEQTSVLKLTFQLWSSKKSGNFPRCISEMWNLGYHSYHRENKFHKYDQTPQLLFGSMAPLRKNSAALSSPLYLKPTNHTQTPRTNPHECWYFSFSVLGKPVHLHMVKCTLMSELREAKDRRHHHTEHLWELPVYRGPRNLRFDQTPLLRWIWRTVQCWRDRVRSYRRPRTAAALLEWPGVHEGLRRFPNCICNKIPCCSDRVVATAVDTMAATMIP